MSANFERPPEDAGAFAPPAPGGLDSSPTLDPAPPPGADDAPPALASPSLSLPSLSLPSLSLPSLSSPALSSLPVGARLVLRCRKDWRVATVSAVDPVGVRLNVASPTGHTYRVRRPADAALTYEGAIPLLGEVTAAGWRAALARYDARW